MICIDTNVAIATLNRRPAVVAERLGEAIRFQKVALPAPALHELWYGAANSQRVQENVADLGDEEAALRSLTLFAEKVAPQLAH